MILFWTFEPSDLGFVSDFEFRISNLTDKLMRKRQKNFAVPAYPGYGIHHECSPH